MNYYIYIPGLGRNSLIERQRSIIKLWNSKKRGSLFIDPKWHEDELYLQKLERIVNTIKEFMQHNAGSYCVVGASAGASLAIKIFDEMELDSVVLIAGKLKNAQKIGENYKKTAPSLYDSVLQSEKVINKLKKEQIRSILVVLTRADATVAKKDMIIKGANTATVPIPGHTLGIGYAITLGKHRIFKFTESKNY
jgi:hypothetical protein